MIYTHLPPQRAILPAKCLAHAVLGGPDSATVGWRLNHAHNTTVAAETSTCCNAAPVLSWKVLVPLQGIFGICVGSIRAHKASACPPRHLGTLLSHLQHLSREAADKICWCARD